MSEIGMCLTEIRHTARHLREWSRPQRVPTPLMHFPGSSRIVREPRGVCLIIAPWNYPFLLAVGPMISAIAAGNCVTLKPSEYAPATAAVLEKMLDVCFEGRFCRTVTGGAEVSAAEKMCIRDRDIPVLKIISQTGVSVKSAPKMKKDRKNRSLDNRAIYLCAGE